MRLFGTGLVLAFACVAAASRLGSGAVVHDERTLQEIKEVVWVVEVNFEEGATIIDPDTAVCRSNGDDVPYYDFVKDVAVKVAKNYFLKSEDDNESSERKVLWELGEVDDVVEFEDIFDRSLLESDQGRRALLPGFKFTIIGTCSLCGFDNGDGRRLGSSNGEKQTLTNRIAKAIMRGMKSKCGIDDVESVSFSPKV
ncbi:hypothetical protein MHU86_20822 [Fragilaria crotonensis]|nr:hypothetical protein MHU86_20822 [Fragilaria crotonensis]